MQLPASTDISGRLHQSKVPAFGIISDELDQVKRLINEQLAASSDKLGINRLLETFGSCSGKMLRPGLVLLAGGCCGKITEEHIRTAAAVEIIHNATLLHDDVVDEGQKRRGQPTVNSMWGNEAAVLLGDFLLSRVLKMCAEMEPKVTNMIAATTTRICEGELRQIAQRQNWQLSESEHIEIITEKTAVLFSCSCYLGGFLAGADETQIRSLADFGLNTGIAFQITDDLLDIVGNERKTAKTLGSDVNKSKLTLAVIHLLNAMDERGRSAVKNKLSAAPDRREALAEMLRSSGSLEYARSRVQEYIARAIASLACLKESDGKEALIEAAEFIGRRPI